MMLKFLILSILVIRPPASRGSGGCQRLAISVTAIFNLTRSRAGRSGIASRLLRRSPMTTETLIIHNKEELGTPTDLGADAVRDISGALNALLADMFALYLKTKNFHWHVSGPHFRDFHLLATRCTNWSSRTSS
jgi:hypothetical protein